MMWCYIYRSTKRENNYLYVDKENDFSNVPDVLMNAFGQPVFVMKVWLDGRRKFVVGTSQEIEARIKHDGFFLQMLKDDDFNVNID